MRIEMETFRLISMEKWKAAKSREVIRVRTAFEGTTLEQLYSLGEQEKRALCGKQTGFQSYMDIAEGRVPHRKGMQPYRGRNRVRNAGTDDHRGYFRILYAAFPGCER